MLAVILSIPYDWFFLGLRLSFVGLIYLFLWQVMRITMRELNQSSKQPARPRRMRAKLVVIDPAESVLEKGATYSINAKTTIGRRPDCTIVIDEPFLSGVHAEIVSRNHAWYLTDLDSTNGTFLNGRPVTGTVYIEADDVVQFGRIKLQLVA